MEENRKDIREYTLEMSKANLYGTAIIIPFTVLLFTIFEICFPGIFSGRIVASLLKNQGLSLLIATIVGIVVHELIHGFTWAIYCRQKFSSIIYGFSWKTFTPYCHCKEPLTVKKYRRGVIMPLIILGVIPLSYSYYSGSLWSFLFGWFFTITAVGDLIALWLLRNVEKTTLVQDHESKVGCYVCEKK